MRRSGRPGWAAKLPPKDAAHYLPVTALCSQMGLAFMYRWLVEQFAPVHVRWHDSCTHAVALTPDLNVYTRQLANPSGGWVLSLPEFSPARGAGCGAPPTARSWSARGAARCSPRPSPMCAAGTSGWRPGCRGH